MKLGRWGANTFDYDPGSWTTNACSGDSGAPVFIDESGRSAIVGIHVGGYCSDASVNSTAQTATMVAPFRQHLLQESITAHWARPSCGADGLCAMACPTADPDCGSCDRYDSVCNSLCPLDPDCEPGCNASDGRCLASCRRLDPECRPCSDGVCVDACREVESDCRAPVPPPTPQPPSAPSVDGCEGADCVPPAAATSGDEIDDPLGGPLLGSCDGSALSPLVDRFMVQGVISRKERRV